MVPANMSFNQQFYKSTHCRPPSQALAREASRNIKLLMKKQCKSQKKLKSKVVKDPVYRDEYIPLGLEDAWLKEKEAEIKFRKKLREE